jgi:ribosomal protein L40E
MTAPVGFTPSWFLLAAIVLFVFIAFRAARRRQWLEHQQYDPKVCPHCGMSQPGHAAYCRKCGKTL